jgi:hypothetical protein
MLRGVYPERSERAQHDGPESSISSCIMALRSNKELERTQQSRVAQTGASSACLRLVERRKLIRKVASPEVSAWVAYIKERCMRHPPSAQWWAVPGCTNSEGRWPCPSVTKFTPPPGIAAAKGGTLFVELLLVLAGHPGHRRAWLARGCVLWFWTCLIQAATSATRCV